MSIKKSRNAKINFGKVEVSDDDFAPSAVRRRISIMIPEDVLEKLRQSANREGIGYQTLINKILRDKVSKSAESTSMNVSISKAQLRVLQQCLKEAVHDAIDVPKARHSAR